MRTWPGLFRVLCDEDNLEAALATAAAGRRQTPIVARWLYQPERRLRELRERLFAHTWQPASIKLLFIQEPKPRVITVSCFEDRVVHHALCRVIGPKLARSFTDDTFACLPGRGTHRAVLRHQALMRCYPYLLQLDIRKYFPSLPHWRLLSQLTRRFPDPDLQWLLEAILASHERLFLSNQVRTHLNDPGFVPLVGHGLPVGLLTSQVFGNAYLSPLDHYVKRELRVPGYIRYMDDLTLFGRSRGELRAFQRGITGFLRETLGLSLREERARLHRCGARVTYLGHEVDRHGHRPADSTLQRLSRRLLSWVTQPPSEEEMMRSLAATRGLLWW